MDFLQKLDHLMEERGINKNKLSKMSGVPYTTIDGFYKKGYENTKLSTVRKISEALNVSLDYLFDEDEDTKKSPSTAEAVPGDDVLELFSFLNNGLISLGLLSEDEDITKQQTEILISVSRILHAAFDKS